MRIGIDARLMYYSPGGIAEYTKRLVQALARLEGDEEFVILHSRKDARQDLVDAPRFRRKKLWTPSHHRLESWTLPLELRRLGLDILHSPDFIPPTSHTFRSVITVHDLAFLLYPHFLTEESARYYGQIDQAVRRADHIIAVSESTKQDTMQLLGVPERKISVIYEAANPIFRQLERQEARRRLSEQFDLPEHFVLFVSTIEPRKNITSLLQAFYQLIDDYKLPHKLVLAGRKGWLFDDVFATISRLKIEDSCIFLGRVPVEQLLYLYNVADVLVHPAFYEGFGLPPLEAMACGTPVVVSNVSSLPEVVGDAGMLADPNDVEELEVAIYRVLTDADLRADLIERGLKRAALFSWERAARETLEVYREIAATYAT
jgi:glycosyltransferase involved in cell wall biosynthesis